MKNTLPVIATRPRAAATPNRVARTAWILLLALLAPPGLLSAAEVLVNSNLDLRANDGLCTLREALENNEVDGQIWPDCAGDFGPDRIRIQSGLGPIVVSGRLELRRPAVIVGPSGGQVIRPASGNSEQLLWVVPVVDGEYVLDSLTFEGARHALPGTSSGCANKGGAVCVESLFVDVDLVFRNVTFRDNRVVNLVPANVTGGGALYVNVGGSSSVRVEDSLFQNNRLLDNDGDASEGYGGAVLALSPLTISRSVFVNNLLAPGFDGRGAAIHAFGDELTVSRSTFSANGGAVSGAAISVRSANLLLLDSIFDAHAVGIDVVDFAGGLGTTRYLTISNTMFIDNQVRALTITGHSQASISQSTIGNHQVEDGVAGLFARDAFLEIRGTTLADNVSTSGSGGSGARTAAIAVENTTLILEDSSLVGNDTFAAPGQGASGLEALDSLVSIRNSVLANTQFGEANLWRRGSTIVNMRHSLLTPPDTTGEINGSNDDNVFAAVAAFGPLGDYGCATPVGRQGDRCVALRPHSSFATSIINTGSSTSPYDQRGAGFARNDGGGVDMGAFELQPPRVDLATTVQALPEGNAGSTPFSYTLRRNGDLRGTTQVSWQVQGHGANPAGSDDFGGSILPFGTAFFGADQAETSIVIPVQGDLAAENDEGFRVQLTQIIDGLPGSATIATGTILNDDAVFVTPTLSIHAVDVDLPEGSLGFYGSHRFRVTRTQDTSGFCTFALDLAGAGVDPIEQNDLFDTALGTTGTFQMTPGVVSADIEIRIAADSDFEGDEAFSLTLVSPSGCFINQTARVAFSTVVNDDSLFSLDSVNAVQAEGNTGSTAFLFEVSRSGAIDHAATVSWSLSGTGTHPADAADFSGNALPSGQVSMPPGVVTVPLSILVLGDTLPESDEDFRVSLGNPRSGGSIDPLEGSRIGVIVNDDSAPVGDFIFGSGFE